MVRAAKSKTPVGLVEQLFNAVFEICRAPRSAKYKRGVRSTLDYRIHGTRVRCPYSAGTASAGPYFAGITEGHAIWLDYQDAQARADLQAASSDQA